MRLAKILLPTSLIVAVVALAACGNPVTDAVDSVKNDVNTQIDQQRKQTDEVLKQLDETKQDLNDAKQDLNNATP